ncbi:hypothetical protein DFS34DRAFT_615139 [Phlyctochytrium arcticum]|nr:hypothetical protein DFS34DRAFT_615139 [Phlyctochytrium arcticum]
MSNSKPTSTNPTTLIKLPDELILHNLLPHLPTQALLRLGATCKHFTALLAQHDASLWRPLVAHIIPSSRNESLRVESPPADLKWKDVYREWDMWTRGFKKALYQKWKFRLEERPAIDDTPKCPDLGITPSTSNTAIGRRYITALPPTDASTDLSVHLSPPSTLVLSTPSLTAIDLSNSSPFGTDNDDNHAFRNVKVKWIDPSFDQPEQMVTVNEWDYPYAGGWTSLWKRQPQQDQFKLHTRFRCLPTAHMGVVYGPYLACCTAWWTLAEPTSHTSDPGSDHSILRLWDITQGTPDMVWEQALEQGTRAGMVVLSKSYCACVVEGPEGYTVQLHDVQTGHLLACIYDMSAADANDKQPQPFDVQTGIQSLHIFASTILIQTAGTLHIYGILTLRTTLSVHLLTSVNLGDTSPLTTIHFSSSVALILRDQLHPQKICLIQPAEQRRTWYLRPFTQVQPKGVWVAYEDAEGPGVLYKTISDSFIDNVNSR